jgi:hypothetical protein
MNALTRRVRRLEHHLRPLEGKLQRLWVVCRAGWGLALDQDACLQILRECGFLPTGPLGLVNEPPFSPRGSKRRADREISARERRGDAWPAKDTP